MKVVCIWCQTQGLPAVLREEEPLDDAVVRGLCNPHAIQLLNDVRKALLKRSLVPIEVLPA